MSISLVIEFFHRIIVPSTSYRELITRCFTLLSSTKLALFGLKSIVSRKAKFYSLFVIDCVIFSENGWNYNTLFWPFNKEGVFNSAFVNELNAVSTVSQELGCFGNGTNRFDDIAPASVF